MSDEDKATEELKESCKTFPDSYSLLLIGEFGIYKKGNLHSQ